MLVYCFINCVSFLKSSEEIYERIVDRFNEERRQRTKNEERRLNRQDRRKEGKEKEVEEESNSRAT